MHTHNAHTITFHDFRLKLVNFYKPNLSLCHTTNQPRTHTHNNSPFNTLYALLNSKLETFCHSTDIHLLCAYWSTRGCSSFPARPLSLPVAISPSSPQLETAVILVHFIAQENRLASADLVALKGFVQVVVVVALEVASGNRSVKTFRERLAVGADNVH